MVGDIWLTRSHGGPGLRGWIRRQIGDMITLVKLGRHLPWNHAMVELEGGQLLDAGARVQLTDWRQVVADPYLSVLVVRQPLTQLERVTIHEAGIRFVGQRYSYWTALGHTVSRKIAAWVARREGGTVICSELVAQVMAIATGFRFTQRHTDDPVEPDAARPRDIAWTVSDSNGKMKAPWSLVLKTSHGKVVAHAGIA